MSTTFKEFTSLWCRCLPLSSLWKKQSLPNRNLVQSGKSRGDRSCPPSCSPCHGPGRSLGRCWPSMDREREAGLELMGLKATEVVWGPHLWGKWNMHWISFCWGFWQCPWPPKYHFSCFWESLAFPLVCSQLFFWVRIPKKCVDVSPPFLLCFPLSFRWGALVLWPKDCVLCLIWWVPAGQTCDIKKVFNPGGPTFSFVECPFIRKPHFAPELCAGMQPLLQQDYVPLEGRSMALDWERARLDEVMVSKYGMMLLYLLWAVLGCPFPWLLPVAQATAPLWSQQVVMKLLLTKHLTLNYRHRLVAHWMKTVNT